MPAAAQNPRDPALQRTLRRLAEQAARAGGRVARQHFARDLAVRLKPDRSEVSDADEAAQAAVVACLRARRPDDALIAEETLTATGPAPANDRLCWAIDPIDGTRNFVRRIPLYACSVAALLDGAPLVGAVYDVARDVLYSASQAEGLCIDGRPAAARAGRPPGGNPRPVVGLPSNPAGPVAAIAHAWLDRFICRNLGSTALHLVMVATGELDAMLSDNPRLWDIAAGCLAVTATGGRVCSPAGGGLFPLDVRGYAGAELPVLACGPGRGAALGLE